MEETDEKEHVSPASHQEVAPAYWPGQVTRAAVPSLELAVQLQASAEPSPGGALEKHQLLALPRGRVARRET